MQIANTLFIRLSLYTLAFLLSTTTVIGTAVTAKFIDPPQSLVNKGGILGINVRLATTDTLEVTSIRPFSSAFHCGIQPGDRLLVVTPYRVRSLATLARVVQSYAPGTTVDIHLERDGMHQRLSCSLSSLSELSPLMASPPSSLPPANGHLQILKEQKDPFSQLLSAEIVAHNATDAALKLEEAFIREVDRFGRNTRLHNVDFALTHPFKSPHLTRQLTATFTQSYQLSDYLKAATIHLDLVPPASPTSHPLNGNASLLDQLLSHLDLVATQMQKAFAPLSLAQQDTLLTQIPTLLEQFSSQFMLNQPISTTPFNTQTLRLANQIALGALFNSALSLASLSSPNALKNIRRLASQQHLIPNPTDLPPEISGDFLLAYQSRWGWILIGDKKPNYYGIPTALIIDLGGNDTYTLPYPSFSPSQPTLGLIIDFDGNDHYISHALGGFAGALGGLRLLIDLKGNDLYQGTRLSQGAAFCGIGILWDQRGNDTYLAQELAQGAGIFGFAALLDQQGNDLFSATQFAQGFGGTKALGLLIDAKGNDRYLAGGKTPSTYGTEKIYRSWSQGVGCGFRDFTAGGIGLLLDKAGHDFYQAGNFSQGIGYFFGMGVLADHQGNDQYYGSRYAQGAAAHQALGLLLDDKGNDYYQSQIAAAQGSGWDAAIGILWDRQGNDQYQANHLSQGAAAMNGLGILLDQSGHDNYRASSDQAQAYGGSTDYHDGRQAPNLGILLDGAGNDTYTQPTHQNSLRLKIPGLGLFSDR